MSDAKLASTHPRKARNTQLVKDPDKASDAQSEALPPGCRSSVVGFRASPFQTTSTYYRGHPGCQASGPNFWETALTPPESGSGSQGREDQNWRVAVGSLGGVLGQILVKERTSLYNTIMVGSCDPVKNFPVFSGFFL